MSQYKQSDARKGTHISTDKHALASRLYMSPSPTHDSKSYLPSVSITSREFGSSDTQVVPLKVG